MTRHILGDPHLGRAFVTGVPLHRRGDREAMVWRDFEASLAAVRPDDVHIMMGDLFDKAQVSYTTVMRAAALYRDYAGGSQARWIVLRGNHDASRDLEARSAFDVFAAIVASRSEIVVVAGERPRVIGDTAYFGWHPTISAAELAATLPSGIATEAFGHWDVDPRSADFNLIPAAQLRAAGITEAWIGHDHRRRDLVIDGLQVRVVGSMQPYAHGEGEGREDDPYVTLTLAEARARAPELRDRCVRITLQPGETYDAELDCLALTFKAAGTEVDAASLEVRPDPYDLAALFDECMDGVPAAVRDLVHRRWSEHA